MSTRVLSDVMVGSAERGPALEAAEQAVSDAVSALVRQADARLAEVGVSIRVSGRALLIELELELRDEHSVAVIGSHAAQHLERAAKIVALDAAAGALEQYSEVGGGHGLSEITITQVLLS